jgi:hypothetical protein
MSYDVHIPRCTHIKTNGTQCGSPALRGRRFCFFHKNWQGQRIALNVQPATPLSFTMPVLEDADSVQVALMQVMRLILAGQLEPRIAGLLLYALQTASINLRHMKLEPLRHETVVIDPRTVSDNGLDEKAWSEEEFEEEEDDEEEEDEDEDSEDEDTNEEEEDESDDEEDSAEEEQEEDDEEEDEPAQPSAKPPNVARAPSPAPSKPVQASHVSRPASPASRRPPSPSSRRPPGVDKNAIVVDCDGNSLARHLLEQFDFEPRPPK